MTQPIDRPGVFQGQIVEYGLKEETSNALTVVVRARIDNHWNSETEEWEDWKEYDLEVMGYLCIVKRNGETHKPQVESLVKFAGWDGSFNSIVQATWNPTPCQFTVEESRYNDKVSYRIGFINDHDRIPGGSMSNVDAEKAKQLENKYGSSMRSIVGTVKQNKTPAPPTKMPAPSRKQQPTKEANKEPATAAAGADDIPF